LFKKYISEHDLPVFGFSKCKLFFTLTETLRSDNSDTSSRGLTPPLPPVVEAGWLFFQEVSLLSGEISNPELFSKTIPA